MADAEEDTLLASMKEAIAKDKEPEVTEESEKVEDEEKDTGADKDNEEDVSSDDAGADKEKADKTEEDDSSEDAQPTRGQNRHQKLSNQLKEERAEREKERKERDELVASNARKEVELEQFKRQQTDGQSAAQRKAEEERLSLLTPEERTAYNAQQKANHLEQRLNRMELERQDDRDRLEFRAKSAQDPLVEKYADRVEQMRQDDIKRLGVAAPRDAYLNFIVGESIRKDATKKASSKKEAAGKRISSVTSKSATARGDVSGTKSGKGDSLEEIEARLRNVTF